MNLNELNSINDSKGRSKAIGLIFLDDVHLIQLSSIDDDGINFDAPIGSFCFDDPDFLYTKVGAKPTDWERTVFSISLTQILDKDRTLLEEPDVKVRKKIREHLENSLLVFDKGKPSEKGLELQRFVKGAEFIGFTPSIKYILEKHRVGDSDEIFSMWEHPFSDFTGLYKVKDLPMLIIVNPHIKLDETRLSEININSNNKTIMSKHLKGISG